MNVLMVNTYHYLRGGDSRCALGLSSLLRGHGHQVAPFAMKHRLNEPSPFESHFADELDYPSLMAQGGIGSSLKVLRRSIHNAQARSALRGMLRAWSPDIAHLHSVMHHLTASVPRELMRQRIPIVWTLHDLKSVCPTTLFVRDDQTCEACSGGRFYNALRHRCKRGSLGASALVTAELYLHRLWKLYEKVDVVVAPSRFLRDKVVASGLKPRRIEVVPNFVEAQEASADPARGEYLLYVGRLESIKGVLPMLEASVRAGRVPIRIVGTGELEASLRSRSQSEGWDHVVFEGYRSGAELMELYRGARALVVPSTCQENAPMVALEAFAHGLGVLGSSIGGIPELVENEKTGLLVEAGDVEAWSTAMRRTMESPLDAAGWGVRAKQKARESFSPELHRDRMLRLYEEVVAESRFDGGRVDCA